MEFRICPTLSGKPHTIGAPLPSAFHKSRPWGPGSDMYCPDERLLLTHLNGTHDLALNLFCIDRPQLLVLTLDSYKRQREPLDQDDFAAMMEVLRCLPRMYLIFNCGEEAGCSRVHKHMQGLIGPPYAFEALIRAELERRKTVVPFQYFAHYFSQGFQHTSASDLTARYTKLLSQSRRVLGLEEESYCPHNVIVWNDWIIVIPRRAGFTGGASANAAGMLGSAWVKDQAGVDAWLKIGCAKVLRELGVPFQADTKQ